jgi:hypothetical protein
MKEANLNCSGPELGTTLFSAAQGQGKENHNGYYEDEKGRLLCAEKI